MPRLFLHVGYDKTGTTAIQKQLAQREDEFSKLFGFEYPLAGRKWDHHIQIANYCGFGIPENIRSFELDGTANRAVHKRFLEDEPICDLVVSSEHFSFLAAPDAIERAAKLFKQYDVSIIVYVRSPASWLASLYSEAVKWGEQKSFETFMGPWSPRCDYEKRIALWEQAFGDGSVTVLLYDRHKDRLLPSFIEALGRDADLVSFPVSRVNPSISLVDCEIVRKINAFAESPPGDGAYTLFKNYERLKDRNREFASRCDALRMHVPFDKKTSTRILEFAHSFADRYLSEADRELFIANTTKAIMDEGRVEPNRREIVRLATLALNDVLVGAKP